jgi:hypothetical protein
MEVESTDIAKRHPRRPSVWSGRKQPPRNRLYNPVIGAVIVGGAFDLFLMLLPTETRVTLRERPQLDRVWTDTDPEEVSKQPRWERNCCQRLNMTPCQWWVCCHGVVSAVVDSVLVRCGFPLRVTPDESAARRSIVVWACPIEPVADERDE